MSKKKVKKEKAPLTKEHKKVLIIMASILGGLVVLGMMLSGLDWAGLL